MSQADAINSSAAEAPDWLQSVIDIPGPPLGTPPHEEPKKIQRIPPTLLENTSEEDYVKYYKPHVISIGPIHHGRPYVIPMEDFKRKAVSKLAETVKNTVSIGQVCARVEEKLLSARNFYSGSFMEVFEDDAEWCKMMFLDGCFVVAFICDMLTIKDVDSDLVSNDLLLYENQLPFEVLDALADAFRSKKDFHSHLSGRLISRPFMLTKSYVPAHTFPDCIESCLGYIFRRRWWWENFNQQNDRLRQWDEKARASTYLLQYYLELLIFFFFKNDSHLYDGDVDFPVEGDADFVDLLENLLGTLGAPPSRVTELKKVGIKCSSSTSQSDISFYSYMLSGKLFLPQLTFDRRRKTLILNLAAYEFSCSPKYRSSGILSYLSFMGTFIHEEEDVKELRARGLVQLNHKDYDDHAVVDFFRYITAHHEPNPKVISDVKEQISTYCKSKMLPPRVAYAEFKQRYFSGPWNFLVFLAVVFTVSMTIIQTVLTGIQTFKKD